MSKNKLARYRALLQLDNVIELEDYSPHTISMHRGRWAEAVFGNDHPIVAELACGKGDYTLELARRYPDVNFIGVDVKGDRLWKGAEAAATEGLDNVRFLRIYIDHLQNYFAPGEISDLWITFPDPYLAERKKLKRLTSPVFLVRYRNVLRDGGSIRLKTDSTELFDYTLEVLAEEKLSPDVLIRDVHHHAHHEPDLDILTYYERQHLADRRVIRYVRFRP
jgi:tRNA (guanine-N7-)-methyltransferase